MIAGLLVFAGGRVLGQTPGTGWVASPGSYTLEDSRSVAMPRRRSEYPGAAHEYTGIMKPIKGYILNHRHGDQTRLRPGVVWSVAIVLIAAVAVLVYQVL